MCCRFRGHARSAWLLTAAAAVVTACGVAGRAWAEDAAEHEEGRIVGMSADGDASTLDFHPDHEQGAADEAPAVPAYWLGIQGQPVQSDVLRTHLQLAEDVGIVIEEVVPGSPAEKAGLRRHDVLLDVGGEQISDMSVLQKAVADSQGKALTLKVIRLSKETTIEVTPEAPPADLAAKMGAGRILPRGGGVPMDEIQGMLQKLQQNGIGEGGGIRVFGPGMMLGGQQFGAAPMPSNLQVTMTREGDGPAKITVKRGDESWTLEGDDQEALAKLPDDVRPFVEQMIQSGQSGGMLHQGGIEGVLPGRMGGFDFKFDGRDLEALRETAESMMGDDAHDGDGVLRRRLEEMEKRLERFERRFRENSGEEAEESSEPSA